YDALRSDGIYIDDQQEVKDKENIKPSNVTTTTVEEHSVQRTTSNPVVNVSHEEKTSHMNPDHVAIPSEPEENWDDEDEDNYEEDDYVTAPSHRFRGDNTTAGHTTGGHTTVLFPKVTQKTRRELAVAKQIVNSTRTVEDWQDELWDTSMVAEYGDEIFQY